MILARGNVTRGEKDKSLILGFSQENPFKIGYIQPKYLNHISGKKYKFKINNRVTLRLKPIYDDPNTNLTIQGPQLKKDETFILPFKDFFKDKDYVIVRDSNDPTIFGYIDKYIFSILYNY